MIRPRYDEHTGQACSDCSMLMANGETPPELSEDDTAAYLARIDERWGADQVHASLTCDGEDDHTDFSWAPCNYCGSTLGGSRCPFVVLVPVD